VIWKGRDCAFDLSTKTIVMGIINATPDSFSDGGLFATKEEAVARAMRLIEEGADIIDLGGESTRPGSDPVDAAEEIRRVVPVLEEIRRRSDVPLSVDTRKAVVAEAALVAGANVVNDVSALGDPEMAPLVAKTGAGLIVMHMLREPKTMQDDPVYRDVLEEVNTFLRERVDRAVAAGIARENIAVDPGIGFGKTLEHNLAIMKHLRVFGRDGLPIAVGPSRKRFIGMLTGAEVGDRLPGTLAAVVMAVAKGAHILRVHDVAATVQATQTARAILRA